MLLDKSRYKADFDVEFLFERPIGWSSACLDSTIDYYLDCTSADLEIEEAKKKPKTAERS